jgi:hypothetical protein
MWMQRKRGIFRIAMALGDLDGVHSFPPWCSRTASGELACNTSLTPCEQNASTPIHINYKTDLLNSNFRREMFTACPKSQPHMTCTPPLGFPCRLNSPRCLSAGAHNEVEERDMGKRRTKEMTCASTSPPYPFPWQLRGFKRCSSLITQKAELASGMLDASSTCEHRSTRDLRALPR